MITPIAGTVSMPFQHMFLFVNKQESGTPKMKEIAAAIKDGAKGYLKRQKLTRSIFVAVLSLAA